MAEAGSKNVIVKTAAATSREPLLTWYSLPPLKHPSSGACDGCQILSAQRLFSLPEWKKHAYRSLWQQSKTGKTLRTHSTFAKGSTAPQSCLHSTQHHHGWDSPLLSSSVMAVALPQHSNSAGERGGKGPFAHAAPTPHLSVHGAGMGGTNQGLQASSILFNTFTAAVQLYALCYGLAIHPSAGLPEVQVSPSPEQHHFIWYTDSPA